MALDISNLQSSFIDYLNTLKKYQGKEIQDNEKFSVFNYSVEFRNFLNKQDGINVNGKGLSIEEIISTLNDSDNDDVIAALEAAKVDLGDENASNVIDFLSFMMQDEEFSSAMDADGNNTVDKSEFMTFLNSISKKDNDSKDITLRDLLDGGKEVKEGKYKMPDVKDWSEIAGDIADTETDSASSASGGSSSYNGSTASNTTTQDSSTEKTYSDQLKDSINTARESYSNLSLDELNDKKATQQTNLEEAKNQYTQASSSSGDLEPLKADITSTYEQFLVACEVTDEVKDQAVQLQESILAKEQEYNETSSQLQEKQAEQVQLEVQITTLTSQIGEIDSSISALESSKPSVSDGATDEEKASIQAAIAQIDAQIASLNSYKEELNAQKEAAEVQKTAVEEKITGLNETLSQMLTEYTQLQEQLTTINETLASQGETQQQAYDTYTAARNTYDTKQAEMFTEAKTAITSAYANIAAIEDQIRIVEYQEKMVEIFPPDEENKDEQGQEQI